MLLLEPSVSVELRAGGQAMTETRYYLQARAVSSGPLMNVAERAQFVRQETFGSARNIQSPNPSDEFRFRREGGFLARLDLAIPADPELDRDRVSRWLSVDSVPGTLRLAEPEAEFYVEPASTWWIGDRQLLMLRGAREEERSARLKIQVSPGLHLLFADGFLTGWVLDDPEYYMCPLSGRISDSPRDPDLARILADFLELESHPDSMIRLSEGDGDLLESFESLAGQADLGAGAADRRGLLGEAIREIIDYWYGSGGTEGS